MGRKLRRSTRSLREIDPVGLKRWYVPGSEFEGEGVLTPYANKEKRRRRCAEKIAKRARKRNRR